MTKQEYYYVLGGIIALLIIVLVGYLVVASKPASNRGNGEEKITTTTKQVIESTPLQRQAPVAIKKQQFDAEQEYTDALNTYRTAATYYQFVGCKGSPGNMVLKQGKYFMLDNRDKVAHTIKVGDVAYSVPAEGFRIAKAISTGENLITCDGGGAARINVYP
jgi:hypothetical protein